MTDRELLERAARAAGIVWDRVSDTWYASGETLYVRPDWNPLTDDGDAQRLAVKLRICIEHDFDRIDVSRDGIFATEYLYEKPQPTDPYAATRRAIVRAAAAMAP